MELICLRKYEKIYIFFKSIINANIYSKLSFEYFNFEKFIILINISIVENYLNKKEK